MCPAQQLRHRGCLPREEDVYMDGPGWFVCMYLHTYVFANEAAATDREREREHTCCTCFARCVCSEPAKLRPPTPTGVDWVEIREASGALLVRGRELAGVSSSPRGSRCHKEHVTWGARPVSHSSYRYEAGVSTCTILQHHHCD